VIKLDTLIEEEILETAGSYVSKVDKDVLILKFKTDQLIVKKEAVLIDQNLCALCRGEASYVIIDALDIQSNMDSAALKYFSKDSDIGKYTKAAAILSNSLPIRLTAGIFIKFHKPIFKTEVFKSQLDALDWFSKLRQD